jgi:predicted RNase H-like HicB family nuclease
MLSYIALIHKDADSDFGVSFPDLPGCVTAGASLDDARKMAAQALALHIEGLAADGEQIPEPSSLEAIMSDKDNRDGVATLVDVPEDLGKTVRINLTVPEYALVVIDQTAKAAGMNRSNFMVQASTGCIRAQNNRAGMRWVYNYSPTPPDLVGHEWSPLVKPETQIPRPKSQTSRRRPKTLPTEKHKA